MKIEEILYMLKELAIAKKSDEHKFNIEFFCDGSGRIVINNSFTNSRTDILSFDNVSELTDKIIKEMAKTEDEEFLSIEPTNIDIRAIPKNISLDESIVESFNNLARRVSNVSIGTVLPKYNYDRASKIDWDKEDD